MGACHPRRCGRLAAAALATGLFAACAGEAPRRPPTRDDLFHASATRRTEAVAEAARRRDRAAVPSLVDLLDDRDETVRMAACAALVEITGRDTGYRPWAAREERVRQAADWRAWWAQASARGGAPGGAPAGGAGYTGGPADGPRP